MGVMMTYLEIGAIDPRGLRHANHCPCQNTNVQVLVVAAYGAPNQDMAFVLGVTYNVLSSLLCGVWVTVSNLVTPVCQATWHDLGSRCPPSVLGIEEHPTM